MAVSYQKISRILQIALIIFILVRFVLKVREILSISRPPKGSHRPDVSNGILRGVCEYVAKMSNLQGKS